MTDTHNPEHDTSLSNCSFCGKHKDAVGKLIVGEKVAICSECVGLCETLLTSDQTNRTPAIESQVDPIEIKQFLDQYVIGQETAKIVLSVAIANHYKRINNQNSDTEIEKVNILMLGPTGSGKTLLARTVARYLGVPFVIADATSLTEAGYVGDDVESVISRLYAAADYDVERCQRGIVFIDEIDKIARKGESTSITRDVSGEGVQQSLLKLVEGTKCRIVPQGGRKNPQNETVEIDTTDILFIAGGAFVGIESLVKTRVKGTSIGFATSVQTDKDIYLDKATPEDIVKFGMIPEFVGRFPSWVSLKELTKQDLLAVLKNIKNNYIEQYQWLFGQDQVKLDFTSAALELVVEHAIENKTGARGLHGELERVLMPHMYHLRHYVRQGITEVIIDGDLVNKPTELKKVNE
jgi:ATP-dependent Clp protease ATP-binding subunit ClpX